MSLESQERRPAADPGARRSPPGGHLAVRATYGPRPQVRPSRVVRHAQAGAACRVAASTVWASRTAMVIGPTP
ncbi:MAG: hypothetical protein ACRDP6_19440, partial [Actinoallomurus sp.]